MTESFHEWFLREILVHERALARFLMHVWPDRSEVHDLLQETLVRVYEAAAVNRPTAPRGFLFATARHLMADRVRRERIVSIELKGDLESLNVLIDEISPERRLTAREEIWHLAEAFDALTPEYRELIWMMKVEELSQQEAAQRLGVTPKAIERRLARGIRQLQQAFCSRPRTSQSSKTVAEDGGSGYGQS